ncbi:MAG: HIRAN domain-containing protein [Promethearchaeota archaeon]
MLNKLEYNKDYHLQIVGIYYTGNGKYLSRLPPKTILDLKPEPDNKYDSYAVSVWHNTFKLGYIPKTRNKPFFNALMKEIFELTCLLGYYIPSSRKNNSHSKKRDKLQPERANITIHTYSTPIEWRPAVFYPEDSMAY